MKHYIGFRAKRNFAAVHIHKGFIDVVIDLSQVNKDPRLSQGKHWGWSWGNSKFKLHDISDIDGKVISWIKESYSRRGN